MPRGRVSQLIRATSRHQPIPQQSPSGSIPHERRNAAPPHIHTIAGRAAPPAPLAHILKQPSRKRKKSSCLTSTIGLSRSQASLSALLGHGANTLPPHRRPSNLHSASRTAPNPAPAVSSLAGFRTPAASARRPSSLAAGIRNPSQYLPRKRTSQADALCQHRQFALRIWITNGGHPARFLTEPK
jgi:hypothetical protein